MTSSEHQEYPGRLIVDAPDHRETCTGCAEPFEVHTTEAVRELGGAERVWHLACAPKGVERCE